ncbi:reverse transcriptase domain-containing protein [Tanacetum coccineum]
MQSSANRFLRRNRPPSGNNRPSSNHGKGRKEQNDANGVCNNKMSFTVQRNNRKDRNEKPRSARKGARFVEGGKQMSRIREQAILRTKSSSGHGPSQGLMPLKKTWDKENSEEVFTISQERPNQHVTMGTTLTTDYKRLLTDVLQENMEVSYGRRGILFHPHAKRIKKLGSDTSEDDGKGLGRSKRAKHGSIPGRNSSEKQNGERKVPWPYGDEVRTISKFIPKLAELKYPIREVRMRFETTEGSGWTNEAEESLRRIKRKLNKLQALAITKEGEVLMLCLQQRSETISSMLLVEREGIQIHVSYVSRPLQAMEICYTPMEKMVHALIHTTRSLRTIFRKHKYGHMTSRTAKKKEAEGSVVKKFFGQGEQVQETPDANEGEMSNLSKKLQAKSTPTPRA